MRQYSYMKDSQRKLQNALSKANQREYDDDHLSDAEKADLVSRYKKEYPEQILPEDVAEAYLLIIAD